MRPEIKAQLIAALRSGDYTQGRGYLNKDGCHCFGGVLCDLAVKAGVARWSRVPAAKTGGGPPVFSCVPLNAPDILGTCSVPDKILEWAGFDGMLAYEDGRLDFYELNDDNGLSFQQFADLLEAAP